MAKIQVDVELDYPSDVSTVPANSQAQYQYTPASGYALLNWGYGPDSGGVPYLRLIAARIVPAPGGLFKFVADVENTDSSDHDMEWFFVAMKK